MKNDFKPVVDHRFNLQRATGAASTARSWPSSRTRRCPTPGTAYGLESVVTWTLTPTGTGTHLRMEQSGFRPDQQQAYQGAKHGWQQFVADLERVVGGLS